MAAERKAAHQHGVVSRGQLRRLGASEEAIEQGVAAGRLFRLFRSVYSLGRADVEREGRLLAAVLACGPGAVVSHGTAAALLGLWDYEPPELDVIAPIEAGRKLPGIRRRFVPLPESSQVVRVRRVPCTNVARTVVDMAGILRRPYLDGIVEQAAVLRALDVAAIDAILAEHNRRGAKRLSAILEPWRRYPRRARIRSRMEARLLPLLTLHSLPVPQTNAKLRIAGEVFEVDFLWRSQKVVVETDGGRFHDNPIAEYRDGHRNRVLARAGYKVPRVGWDELTGEPDRTIAEIRRFLAPAVP